MFSKFLNDGNYKRLLSAVEQGEKISVFGLNMGEKLALVEDSAFLFYVVENRERITEVYDKLVDMGRVVAVLEEPLNVLTSEFVSYEKYLSILFQIKQGLIDTLLITPEILACKFPTPSSLNTKIIKLQDNIEITSLIKDLIAYNYKRVDMVSNPNEFSVRGDVVDVYPSNLYPVRIFIDYDTIESIKQYNPITMLTTTEIDSVTIPSMNFYNVSPSDITDKFNSLMIAKDALYDELIMLKPNDYRLINFASNFKSKIFDYVDDAVIVFDGAKNIFDNLNNFLKDFNNALINQPKNLVKLSQNQKINLSEVLRFPDFSMVAFQYIVEANRLFVPTKVFNIRTLPAVSYHNYIDALKLDIANYAKQNYTVILCAGSDEGSVKFENALSGLNLNVFTYKSMSLCNKNCINIVSKKYSLDIILPEEKLAIISTNSLIGRRKKVIEMDKSFFDGEVPQSGDFVVHNIHGVGKCLGVETLKITNGFRDYVIIEYKNSDKLYLPVENIDQISKYIGSDKAPVLNKIGGVEFAKTKERVKSSVKKIAFDLIGLYRDRLNQKGYKYSADDEMQSKFEGEFPYSETADQLKAIDDCKHDMENGKVMDRLVCGDVGFGKTEVALRIAFKTILSGRQVALLCPTTILSEQHFNTAKTRMANFGVKIEVLNRLKSPKEIEKIKKDLADGKIDMLCGTHKLLGKDVEFKYLGLLILDEEQKFGVADKEKIKNIKKSINVLTMSATPIPRTLNMSLIGVRDISVIETPPDTRIASEVQVVEYSDFLAKGAIERELSRKGQVLVIFNRIEGIYEFASHIKSLVPSAQVSVAHGQMTDVELEQEIYNLYSNKTQVLVSTTLIENGVDLPNANTLIVVNSDNLGLSQLYQLKGRIGRSDKMSYAYFTFDSRKNLTDNACKRLQAISEFTSMGSGFKIAMRDLEIRGAGSILGLEQSGHIEKIGYNLYVELLGQSVKELKGEKIENKSEVRVETTISAYLTSNYISSVSKRMSIYRDIAGITSLEQLTRVLKDTESVYGDLPLEFVNLCYIGYIKNLCASISASKISIKDKTIIYLKGRESITKNILNISDMYRDNVSLDLSNEPIIKIENIEKGKILDFIVNYLQLIVKN